MLTFLDYHAPVDGDPLVLSLILIFYACQWENFILSTMFIGVGGGGGGG